MTSLKLTVSDAATAAGLEADILTTIYKKLEEYDYKPSAVESADADATVRHLEPKGTVWFRQVDNTVDVKLHNVDVDKKDLFTAVLADLEQRNDGLAGEID